MNSNNKINVSCVFKYKLTKYFYEKIVFYGQNNKKKNNKTIKYLQILSKHWQ